jgi:hypothetical protein
VVLNTGLISFYIFNSYTNNSRNGQLLFDSS